MRDSIIVASVVCILTGGVLLFSHSPSSKIETVAISAPEIYSSNRSPASSVARPMEALDLNREIQATLVSGKSKKEFAHVFYRGTFFVFWKNEKTAEVLFSLENGTQSKIAFEFDLNSDWKIEQIRAQTPKTEIDEDCLNILKDFASIYAFQSTEDTTGRYESTMRNLNGKTVKQKIRYSDPKLSRMKIVESLHEIILNPEHNRVSMMKGEEKTEVAFGKGSVLKTVSSYVLKAKAADAVSAPQKISTAHEMKPSNLAVTARDHHLTVNWDLTMSNLKTIANLDKSARLALFHDLVKGLKEDPAHLAEFKTWLTRHSTEPGVLIFGVGVLATAGTEEAQKALLALYQSVPESRHSILNSMATTDAVLTAEVRSFLASVGDQKQQDADLSYNAALAMGSAMKKEALPGEDQKLMSWYTASSSSEEKTLYLDAMGNSGDSAFIPTLEKALASTDESIREKAAFAARFMKPEDAQTLVSLAFDDPSLKVKTAAIKAISYQNDVTAFQTILNRCVGEKSDLSPVCSQILNPSHG